MEIYNSLETQASKEFKELLSSQLSKSKNLAEGKIIEGKVTKITEKFIFLFIEGLKSEPVIDVNEVKTLGLLDNLKVGGKISVLLERIEDKNGEVLVSASKALKIRGWDIPGKEICLSMMCSCFVSISMFSESDLLIEPINCDLPPINLLSAVKT